MNRGDLQALADLRVREAQALLAARCWAGAYYLLGYAVECALKACASRQFGEHEVPDRDLVRRFYTHQLDGLLNISDAKAALHARAQDDPQFSINWNTVCGWSEASRYDHTTSEAQARDMLAAVADPQSGVLPWLKTVW